MFLFVQTASFWSCYIDNSVIILRFIHNQIHTYTFIVNNEKLKTSFALIRVLTIVIIDGSANVRFIKGLGEFFFCASLLCLRSSIFNDLFSSVFNFISFLLIEPLNMVTSMCLLYTRLSATRKEEALFVCILIWYKIATCIVKFKCCHL